MLQRYLLDPNVSILKKVLVLGTIAYIFSPLDLLPDPILGFGFIDDAFILIYVITMLSEELDEYIDKNKECKINKEKVIDNIDYEIKEE